MEHTKGPWKVGTLGDEGDRPYITQVDDVAELCMDEPDPRFIATVGCDSPLDGWDAEDIANARLLAAAPALLEALKDAKQVLETAKQYFPKSVRNSDTFSLLNVLANSIKPAIAQAEGE